MKKELSAGFVLFKLYQNKPFYLLVKHIGHWSLPKGHVQQNETLLQAAFRELQEETGISREKISILTATPFKLEYEIRQRNAWKVNYYYPALFKGRFSEVRISEEHFGFVWVDIEEAFELVKYASSRDFFKSVHEWIIKQLKKDSII